MYYRLGFFTGRVYKPSTPEDTIKECTLMAVSEEHVTDEAWVKEKAKELKAKCDGCTMCEESQKE